MNSSIVLLPGWAMGAATMEPVAQTLAAEFQCSVHVQPLPALPDGRVERWLDELEACIAPNTWLIGWSLGGMLALALAARATTGYAGVVSVASNVRFVADSAWPHGMSAEIFETFRHGCERDTPLILKRFARLCSQGDAQAKMLARELQKSLLHGPEDHLLAGLDVLAALNNEQALGLVSVPQMHVFAAQDALVPVTAAAALSECCPQAEVICIEQASHSLVLTHAQELTVHIGGFMQRHIAC